MSPGVHDHDDYDTLVALLARRSARLGDFTLASGKRSSLYVDARLTTMSPEGQALIGPMALHAIRAAGWPLDAAGGLTLGADPISYAIAFASALPGGAPLVRAFTVRKEPKAHGTGKLIEGPFSSGDRVVIVEDVITTGGSALRAAEAVRAAGGVISGILALVDREEGGRQTIEQAGFAVVALVPARDIVARMPR